MTLLILATLLLGQTVSWAQAPTEAATVELIVPAGTQYVNFQVTYLDGAEASDIDFGDGTVEQHQGRYQDINHRYDPVTTEELVIKIDASQLTRLRNTSVAPGFSGFGKVVAPELQVLSLRSNNYSLRDSREQTVDLSQCPKLEEIYLHNVPDIKLPTERTALKELTLSSPASETDRNYATLANKHLDLSGYTTLEKIDIQYQPNLETVSLTGLVALQKLTLKQCSLYKIEGIQALAALTDVELSGNYLPYSSLPIKRSALTSFKYRQNGVRLAPECVDRNRIHLADMLEVKDAEGVAQPTDLKKVRQLNTPRTLKEGLDYILKGSDLVLLERGFGDFTGDNPLDNIQLSIQTVNAYYPDYGKSTYDMPVLKLDIAREGAVYPGGKQPLAFSAGEGGSIRATAGDKTLTTGDEVESGTPLTFTATAADGYVITEWQVNGVTQMTVGINKKPYTEPTLTIDMYSEPMTVTVAFARATETFAVTYSKEGEGQLTATVDGKPFTSGSFLAKGAQVHFEARAFTDNVVKEWQVNGEVIPASGELAEYTLTVEKATEVRVTFAEAEETFVVTYAKEGEGELTVTVDGEPFTSGAALAKGTQVNFDAKAFTGNVVKEWQVNGMTLPAGGEEAKFTLTVQQPSEVLVIFATNDALEAVATTSYQIAQTAQTLTVLGAVAGETIRLYTLSGSLVATVAGDAPISIAQLPAGVYLLQITDDWVKVTL